MYDECTSLNWRQIDQNIILNRGWEKEVYLVLEYTVQSTFDRGAVLCIKTFSSCGLCVK